MKTFWCIIFLFFRTSISAGDELRVDQWALRGQLSEHQQLLTDEFEYGNPRIPNRGVSINRYRRTVKELYSIDQVTEEVSGSVAVRTNYFLKEPLKAGSLLMLWGTVSPDAKWFILNLRLPYERVSPRLDMKGLAVHFRAYFKTKKVVRNTFIEATNLWGAEEKYSVRGFPFVAGQPFKLEVIVEEKQTVWFVDGEYFCTYAHRTPSPVGAARIEAINVEDPTIFIHTV